LSLLPRYTPSLSTPTPQDPCKIRNSKKNAPKIVPIIVNINKDENKSLISNQFSLKILFVIVFTPQNSSPRNGGKSFLREN